MVRDLMMKTINIKKNNFNPMKNLNKTCFVCKKEVEAEKYSLNPQVNLPVCYECKGTSLEKQTEDEYLDSLADGLVCGCI